MRINCQKFLVTTLTKKSQTRKREQKTLLSLILVSLRCFLFLSLCPNYVYQFIFNLFDSDYLPSIYVETHGLPFQNTLFVSTQYGLLILQNILFRPRLSHLLIYVRYFIFKQDNYCWTKGVSDRRKNVFFFVKWPDIIL